MIALIYVKLSIKKALSSNLTGIYYLYKNKNMKRSRNGLAYIYGRIPSSLNRRGDDAVSRTGGFGIQLFPGNHKNLKISYG